MPTLPGALRVSATRGDPKTNPFISDLTEKLRSPQVIKKTYYNTVEVIKLS